MSASDYSLEDVSNWLANIHYELEVMNKTNDWNNSLGNELHRTNDLLERIADSLEKIANK